MIERFWDGVRYVAEEVCLKLLAELILVAGVAAWTKRAIVRRYISILMWVALAVGAGVLTWVERVPLVEIVTQHISILMWVFVAFLAAAVGEGVWLYGSAQKKRTAEKKAARLESELESEKKKASDLASELENEKRTSGGPLLTWDSLVRGSRMHFKYNTDFRNITEITRSCENVRVSNTHHPVLLPFGLDFKHARDAKILDINIQSGTGASFVDEWTSKYPKEWNSNIQFYGNGGAASSKNVVTIARVENAFANSHHALTLRRKLGIPADRDYQLWMIGASAWESFLAEFFWSDENRTDPVVTVSHSYEDTIDQRKFCECKMCPSCSLTSSDFGSGNLWRIELARLRPPMRILLTWKFKNSTGQVSGSRVTPSALVS